MGAHPACGHPYSSAVTAKPPKIWRAVGDQYLRGGGGALADIWTPNTEHIAHLRSVVEHEIAIVVDQKVGRVERSRQLFYVPDEERQQNAYAHRPVAAPEPISSNT